MDESTSIYKTQEIAIGRNDLRLKFGLGNLPCRGSERQSVGQLGARKHDCISEVNLWAIPIHRGGASSRDGDTPRTAESCITGDRPFGSYIEFDGSSCRASRLHSPLA
jgi:hypothetical protein